LKYKLESEERRHRELPKDRPEQKSLAGDGLQPPPENVHESLEAITLRVRIKLARRSLGEQAVIREPTNLQYLREEAEAVFGRIEQRELLRQSEPLANRQSRVPPRSCLALRKELQECRVRDAQNRILAALVCLSRSAFPAEIEYTHPAFKKAYDLLRTNLQLLRDFRRRKVFRQYGAVSR
jgi:hypothetical protein